MVVGMYNGYINISHLTKTYTVYPLSLLHLETKQVVFQGIKEYIETANSDNNRKLHHWVHDSYSQAGYPFANSNIKIHLS